MLKAKTMGLCALLLMLCPGFTKAQVLDSRGANLPLAVIKTNNFDVIHPPHLEAYARRVAAAAEATRERVLGAVGSQPQRTQILVNDETDVFNGYASQSPQPIIRVFATFPRPGDIGMRWESPYTVLVGHEFTHIAHFSSKDGFQNTITNVFGAMPGLSDARVPPAWFTEGYAVYLETELTRGGRSEDASTQTLRAQMLRGQSWPSLQEASIGTTEAWPGGNTRYAFGAGFVPYLVRAVGEAGIRAVLATYNDYSVGDFSAAWQKTHGTNLQNLWDDWTAQERTRSETETNALVATGLPTGQAFVGTGSAAWRDNTTLALWAGGVRVVDASTQTPSPNWPEVVKLPSRPHRLSWTKNGQLVYSRFTAQGAQTLGELYTLVGNQETRISQGARARDAIADGNCILYVQDSATTGSALRRTCPAPKNTWANQLVYQAPSEWHLMQPNPNPGGLIAVSVYRPGGFVDIAVLGGETAGQLRFVTSDDAQDLWPTWAASGELLFASDHLGTFQLLRVHGPTPNATELEPLSAAPGGVYAPAVAPDGRVLFTSYKKDGLGLRLLAQTPRGTNRIAIVRQDPPQDPALLGQEYPLEPYQPNALPQYWLPTSPWGVGATFYASDAAGVFGYTLAAGPVLQNPNGTWRNSLGFGAAFALRFAPRADVGVAFSAIADPYGFGVRLSVPTEGKQDAFGTILGYNATPYVGLDNTGFVAGAQASIGNLGYDQYGNRESGWRLGIGVNSRLAWAAQLVSVVDLGLPWLFNLGVAGLGGQFIADAQLGARFTLDVPWRAGDGIYSLENIMIEPFATAAYTSTTSATGFGYGFGLRFLGNGQVLYMGALSMGVELRYDLGGQFGVAFVFPAAGFYGTFFAPSFVPTATIWPTRP